MKDKLIYIVEQKSTKDDVMFHNVVEVLRVPNQFVYVIQSGRWNYNVCIEIITVTNGEQATVFHEERRVENGNSVIYDALANKMEERLMRTAAEYLYVEAKEYAEAVTDNDETYTMLTRALGRFNDIKLA